MVGKYYITSFFSLNVTVLFYTRLLLIYWWVLPYLSVLNFNHLITPPPKIGYFFLIFQCVN